MYFNYFNVLLSNKTSLVLINFDILCSAVTLSSSEGTNLQERSDPYQICVTLLASPSGGDLTVSLTSSAAGIATCKSNVKPCKQVC